MLLLTLWVVLVSARRSPTRVRAHTNLLENLPMSREQATQSLVKLLSIFISNHHSYRVELLSCSLNGFNGAWNRFKPVLWCKKVSWVQFSLDNYCRLLDHVIPALITSLNFFTQEPVLGFFWAALPLFLYFESLVDISRHPRISSHCQEKLTNILRCKRSIDQMQLIATRLILLPNFNQWNPWHIHDTV